MSEQETQIAEMFSALDSVSVVVQRVIEDIPEYSDDQLETVILHATAFEKAAFLIRGAATAEIQSRLAIRLAGGRAKKDTEQMGVGAHLARLAHRIGRSVKVLETDSRIYRRFGETILADPDPLDREFYSTAVACGDLAEEALEIAYSKKEDPGYTVKHFMLDCKRLCDGVEGEEVKWATIPFSLDEYAWIKEKSKQDGCTIAESVKHLVQKAMKRK